MKRLTKEQFINNFHEPNSLHLFPSIEDFIDPGQGDITQSHCYVLPVQDLKIDNKMGIPVNFDLSQALNKMIGSKGELNKNLIKQKNSALKELKNILQKFHKILQSLKSNFNEGIALVFHSFFYEKEHSFDHARVSYSIIIISSKNNVPVTAELPHAIDIYLSLMNNEKIGIGKGYSIKVEHKTNTRLSVVRYIRDIFFINLKENSDLFNIIKEHLPQVEQWHKQLLAEYDITDKSQIPHLLSGDMGDERVIDFYIKLLLGKSINEDSPQEIINNIPSDVKKAIFTAIQDEIDNYIVSNIYDYYDKDYIKENIKNNFDLENTVKDTLYSDIWERVDSYFMNNPIDEDEDEYDIDDIIQYLDNVMDWGYLNQFVIEPLKEDILSQVKEPSYYVISAADAIETFKEMLGDYMDHSRNPYRGTRDKEEIIKDIEYGIDQQRLPYFIETAVRLIINFAAEKFEGDEEFRDFIFDLVMDYVKSNPKSVLEPLNEALKYDEEIVEEAIRETVSDYLESGDWYVMIENAVEEYLRG